MHLAQNISIEYILHMTSLIWEIYFAHTCIKTSSVITGVNLQTRTACVQNYNKPRIIYKQRVIKYCESIYIKLDMHAIRLSYLIKKNTYLWQR